MRGSNTDEVLPWCTRLSGSQKKRVGESGKNQELTNNCKAAAGGGIRRSTVPNKSTDPSGHIEETLHGTGVKPLDRRYGRSIDQQTITRTVSPSVLKKDIS